MYKNVPTTTVAEYVTESYLQSHGVELFIHKWDTAVIEVMDAVCYD